MQIAQGYLDEMALVAFLQQGVPSDPLAGLGIGAVILAAVLGGLAVNLTPCVLPMIPVNVLVIGRSLRRGLWYASGIFIAYAITGALAAVFGTAIGALQSHPGFNFGTGVLFALLGSALAGFFTLDFSRFRNGLRGGAFFLGVASALLSGACVAPVLVSVLVLSSRLLAEGRTWAIALPSAVGFGLALPWPFLAAGSRFVRMPKPGSWMSWVNRAFALLVFALSAHYLWLGATALFGRRTASAHEASEYGVRSLRETDVTAFAAEGLGAGDGPVLIECWATWCRNCSAQDKLLRTSETVRAALRPYRLVRLQAEDLDELRALPGFSDIRGLPALCIVH